MIGDIVVDEAGRVLEEVDAFIIVIDHLNRQMRGPLVHTQVIHDDMDEYKKRQGGKKHGNYRAH